MSDKVVKLIEDVKALTVLELILSKTNTTWLFPILTLLVAIVFLLFPSHV